MIAIAYTAFCFCVALIAAWTALKLSKKWLYSVAAFVGIGVFAFLVWTGYLENMAARRWGGTMTVALPERAQLISMTWKDDSLWILYYDPVTQKCLFTEDSRLGVLQGAVQVKGCNPVGVKP